MLTAWHTYASPGCHHFPREPDLECLTWIPPGNATANLGQSRAVDGESHALVTLSCWSTLQPDGVTESVPTLFSF